MRILLLYICFCSCLHADKYQDFFTDIETLENTIHYEFYNDDPAYKNKRDIARRELVSALTTLGATHTEERITDFRLELVPIWQLNLQNSSQDQVIRLADGQFEISVQELEALNKSAYATYLADSGLEHEMLRSMLVSGSETIEEYCLAMYRCVVSKVAAFRTSTSKPYHRTLNEPLATYHIYTTNAPNIAYDLFFKRHYMNKNQDRLKSTYKQVLKEIFHHVLSNMQDDGIEVPVLPGFGLGAFLPDFLKPDGAKAFSEALNEVLDEGQFFFIALIFADPGKRIHPYVRAACQDKNIYYTNKSCLDIAHLGATYDIKMGMLNPGDPACITGQFWQKGHIALEEMCALFTTLLFSQTGTMNPTLLSNIRPTR